MFALTAIPRTVVAEDALGAPLLLLCSLHGNVETSQQETLYSLLLRQILAYHWWAIEAEYLINAVKEQSAGLRNSHQLCWIQHISKVTCYIRLCKCQTYSQQNERARVATNTI